MFPILPGMPPSTRLMQAAKELLVTEHHTICGKLHFEALALEVLTQILDLQSRQAEPQTKLRNKNNSMVATAVDILRTEWISPPTISALAKRVGTNECYLRKGFRSQTGMSIGQYILELRMARAMELLETARHSVMDIALAVGYSNPNHFSAAFKKFYGNVPSRYLSESS